MNYQRIHDAIIKRAKNEQRIKTKDGIYYEKHHILPKCLGGGNEKENLVLLTGREHYLVHWLLAEIYQIDGLWYAFNKMCLNNRYMTGRIKPSSRIIEFVKIKTLSYKKRKRSEKELNYLRNNFRGKNHKECSKLKISNSCKLTWTDERRKNQSILSKERWKTGIYNPSKKNKKIIQYTLNEEYIKIWNSIKEASNSLSILDSSIVRCLKGKTTKAGNFKFKYV